MGGCNCGICRQARLSVESNTGRRHIWTLSSAAHLDPFISGTSGPPHQRSKQSRPACSEYYSLELKLKVILGLAIYHATNACDNLANKAVLYENAASNLSTWNARQTIVQLSFNGIGGKSRWNFCLPGQTTLKSQPCRKSNFMWKARPKIWQAVPKEKVRGGFAFNHENLSYIIVNLKAATNDTMDAQSIKLKVANTTLSEISLDMPPVRSCPSQYQVSRFENALILGDANAHDPLMHYAIKENRGNFLVGETGYSHLGYWTTGRVLMLEGPNAWKFQPIKIAKRSYWLNASPTKSNSILTENVLSQKKITKNITNCGLQPQYYSYKHHDLSVQVHKSFSVFEVWRSTDAI